MKRVVIFLVFIFQIVQAYAQQDIQFTQYMFAPLYFNPAAAGMGDKIELTAMSRSQWLGYRSSFDDGGAPTTQFVSGSVPLTAIKGGVGGMVALDKLGPVSNFIFNTNFAYHYQLKRRKGTISVGLMAGVYAQTINFDLYRYIDPDDPKLAGIEGKTSQTKPDMGMGVWYTNDKYYAGLSVSHISSPTFDFGLRQKTQLKKHYYFTAGYWYSLNFDINTMFSTLVKTDLNRTSFDISAIAYYRSNVWGGLSFRQSEAIILLLGMKVLKNKAMGIGYGMGYIIADRQAKQPTSHEIMVRYELSAFSMGKKPIRTPRFRE